MKDMPEEIINYRTGFLFLLLVVGKAFAQQPVFTDNQLKENIRLGVEYTYNYEFEKSERIYKMLVRERPNHPAAPIYYAMMLNWEYFPLTTTSPKSDEFVDSLLKSITICEKMLKKNEDNKEGIFFDLVARLMLMQYYADNDISKKVISHISPAYKMIREGFAYKEEINDFYYSTGIYNYYREAYPEAYPKYKTVAFFFPKGDKKLGLEQLDLAGRQSIFLGAEAISFLSYIYMYFERDNTNALKYSNLLHLQYPDNPLYLSNLIQQLLIVRQYDEAGTYLTRLSEGARENKYFEMLYLIFTGIIEEKKNENLDASEKLYIDAISISKSYGNLANDQVSFAYYGLSRIYNQKGNVKKSKEYRKTANTLSTFREVNFD
jgi:hypothetical protein